MAQAVSYLADNRDHGQFYVAVSEEGEVCSSLLATYENKRSWWIQSVYVKPEHRRKGLFTSLFHNLIKKAKETGVKKVRLYVETEN